MANYKTILTINETDEVNSPLATYVYSESKTTSHPKARVDVLVSLSMLCIIAESFYLTDRK